jgi:hypothetical protein
MADPEPGPRLHCVDGWAPGRAWSCSSTAFRRRGTSGATSSRGSSTPAAENRPRSLPSRSTQVRNQDPRVDPLHRVNHGALGAELHVCHRRANESGLRPAAARSPAGLFRAAGRVPAHQSCPPDREHAVAGRVRHHVHRGGSATARGSSPVRSFKNEEGRVPGIYQAAMVSAISRSRSAHVHSPELNRSCHSSS